MSNKKIDEALGLTNGIDGFLADLNLDNNPEISSFNNIDEKVKENVDAIDSQIMEYQQNGLANLNVTDIGTSLNEIKDLILVSKQTIKHVYESIIDSELPDSELIQSLSKLLESAHLTVAEYINLYRDRIAFYDKVRLEVMKHNQKKELMERKHQMDLEKLTMTKKDPEEGTEVKNMQSFSYDDIIKVLNEDK